MLRFRPLALGLLAACAVVGVAQAAAPAPEPPITATGAEGDYLRAIHRAIHFRWANMFIEEVAAKTPATDPLNNPSLEAELLFTVRWDGSPAEVTVSSGSGVAAFDEAAVDAVKGDRPFPVPPIDVYGDDGVAHFRWIFARDARLDSGGEVRRVEAPLAEALPRLFVQGRIKEALLRVARYTRNGDADAMSTFARSWLVRPQLDPALDARAAAALAHAGDARQADRLRRALNRPDTVALAAPALAALKVDLCAQVRPRLKPTDPEGILFATQVLQAAGAELPAGSPCVATLGDLLKMDALPAPVRAEVLKTLAIVSPTSARRPALNALGDSDAHMRAAAATVFARPGGGRPTLYRLQPLVKDPSVEVRAAVAAGLIRACGDLAIDYVMPLMKAREPQPLVAMAARARQADLGRTLDLLVKMQKRNDPDAAPTGAGRAGRAHRRGRTRALSAAGRGGEEGSLRFARGAPDRLRQRRRQGAGPVDERPDARSSGVQGALARTAPRRGDGLAGRLVRSAAAGDVDRRAWRLAGQSARARRQQVGPA